MRLAAMVATLTVAVFVGQAVAQAPPVPPAPPKLEPVVVESSPFPPERTGTEEEAREEIEAATREALRRREPDEGPSLDDLAARANEAHAAGVAAMRRGLSDYHAAGLALLAAKAKVAHGGWGEWLRENVKILKL